MRSVIAIALVFGSVVLGAAKSNTNLTGEYARDFGALKQLSLAIAKAMPVERWDFRPHSESMNFGMLTSRIATTNYQFCAALKDSDPPRVNTANDRDLIIKLLSGSFDYCSGVIGHLSEDQLAATHNTPDGQLTGREALLAMYLHVAHQAARLNSLFATIGSGRLDI